MPRQELDATERIPPRATAAPRFAEIVVDAVTLRPPSADERKIAFAMADCAMLHRSSLNVVVLISATFLS